MLNDLTTENADAVDSNQQHLRTIDIVNLFSARPAWRLLRGILRAPFDKNFHGSPLAVCWFINFICNANCPFCCKSEEIKFKQKQYPPLNMEGAKKLLEKIRRKINMLYISGGEPTIHPGIVNVLKLSRELEFNSVGLSSNLIALDKSPEILNYIDAIGVSIHSPNPQVHAENLGVPLKTAEHVFENLKLLEPYAKSGKIKVLVNCVINPTNIPTVESMIEFTRDKGFLLELVPANDHGKIPKDLHNNPEYIRLINRLLDLRKSKRVFHLAGSTYYYKTIRDFTPFRCFPYGVPNIMPNGSLCTPCDVSGQTAVNILDYDNIKEAVQDSMKHLGNYPCKKGMCFKAGIVERSRLFGLLVKGQKPDDDELI